MPSTRGDVAGLHELATFLANQGNVLASRAFDVATGASFQPSASAVSAVHDSVTTAHGKLADRMAATGERVRRSTQPRNAGFDVDDELVVSDTRDYRSATERLSRLTQARNLAHNIFKR